MNNRDSGQILQEEEYCFPYHYVSKMPNVGFTQHFVDTWGMNYISTIDFMLSKISECAPRSLLDIGCGDGRLTREINISFPNMKVVGIDYSSRAINLARAMNQDRPGLRYEPIDITQSDDVEIFDVAILMEVFEHIPPAETEQFLAGVRRALRPGGVLFLTVPHANKPVEYKHFQHFTVETISQNLNPFFDIVEIIPFEKKSFARRLLNRILCNRLFVLNNHRLLALVFKLHQKYLFYCSNEQECQRLFVKSIVK